MNSNIKDLIIKSEGYFARNLYEKGLVLLEKIIESFENLTKEN